MYVKYLASWKYSITVSFLISLDLEFSPWAHIRITGDLIFEAYLEYANV